MDNLTQIKKLKDNVNWLYFDAHNIKQEMLAIWGVSEACKENNYLSIYGDYIPYTQMILIDHIYLELAKLYVSNKDSLYLKDILTKAIHLFDKQLFNKIHDSKIESYERAKERLDQLNGDLEKYDSQVDKLKKLRNKNLAHMDIKFNTNEMVDNLNEQTNLSAKEIKDLIEFALYCLNMISSIMFGVSKYSNFKNYKDELKKISKALKYYQNKEISECNKKLENKLNLH